jgi:hypothetical protein
MKICLVSGGFICLTSAFYFFTIWLKFFKRDTGLSLEDKQLSLVILGVATLLWPVVVPLAYIELLSKPKKYCQVIFNDSANQASQ